MPRFSKVTAACVVLLSGAHAQQQDTFRRPNEAVECSSEPIDFLAYGESLGLTCGATECEYKEKAGTLFDIKYMKDYKVIEYTTSPELEGTPLNSATYILHQCGAEQPNDEFIKTKIKANTSDVHFVEIPLTAVATEDSGAGWMLEELDVLDRVRFVGPFATSPCMQKLATACKRPFVGEYALDPTAAKTKVTEYDANFSFESDVATKQIYMQASADPSPLARAEHIVYLSAFFNVEARAIEYYNGVSESYQQKAQATTAAAAPKVAWLTTHEDATTSFLFDAAGEPLGIGIAAVVSFARYKTLLTRDAGGALPSQAGVLNTTGAFASLDDIIFAQSEYANKAQTLAALQTALKGVDVLIDETYHFDASAVSVDALTGFLGLNASNVATADFPFLAKKNIWRHDKAQTENMSDDWFGQAVARPDIVHNDLREMITPGSVPNHTFKFFRNFSKGQNVTVAGPAECTELTCVSYSQQDPLTVDVTEGEVDEGTEGEVDEGTEGEVSVGGQKLVAGAVTAAAVIAAML